MVSENQPTPEEVHPVRKKQEAAVVLAKRLQWRLGHNVSFLLVGAAIAFAIFGSAKFAGFIFLWSALSFVVTAWEQQVYRRSDQKFFQKYAMSAQDYLNQNAG